jgi:hypothetical protein
MKKLMEIIAILEDLLENSTDLSEEVVDAINNFLDDVEDF